ncbi:MAG: hypothetical protein KDC38_07090 [Planctomycetes bacterium]|nr:hypothetical protein [Planctomycetota bacterium]
MSTRDSVTDFWKIFAIRSAEFARLRSADDPVYDDVLESLQKIDRGLYLEFSTSDELCELIVTADGDPRLFDLAESVAASAPEIPGWSVRALKPERGFPKTVTWEGTEVRIADVLFASSVRGDGRLDLTLYVPGLTPEVWDDVANALIRALDDALGERAAAELIATVDVAPASDAGPVNLRPLTELRPRKRH